ncbi:MAG: Nucleotidyl transferase [Bacteroidetes bacterium]|jgi:dTDP-glucose pyrophosphorylase|nr:Nucleotidyl transferase [Bacteroidota bacterium]
MANLDNSTISPNGKLKDAMEKINFVPAGSTLFVIDDSSQKVVGTLTDGDIRRGLLKGITIEDEVHKVMKTSFRYLTKGNYYNDKINNFLSLKLKTIPLLDDDGKLLKIYDLTILKSVLPIDVVFMAGGKGERLYPMTQNTPKPLLPIGNKPILEHNLDRLLLNGVENFYISVNYLGHMIKDHFKDGSHKNARISYIDEDRPLGTIGAVSKIDDFRNETVLIMNSDLLTNIDFAGFYKEFITQNADVAIAAIPYKVSIPYAVMETKDNIVSELKEKPTYTYYSNAGMYLIKRKLLETIPRDTFYNATEFLDQAIERSDKVISYPMIEYWLDIGRPDDYLKAQEDIKHLNFL